jgi:hypothetical protein
MEQLMKSYVISGVIFSLIMTVGGCAGAPANQMTWKPYAETQEFSLYFNQEDTGGLLSYVKDKLSFFEEKIIKVWAKRVSKGDKGRDRQIEEQKKQGLSVRGYDDYAYTLTYWEIQCANKMTRILSEADYTKAGEKLGGYSRMPEVARWALIAPGSPEALLHLNLCTPPGKKGNK